METLNQKLAGIFEVDEVQEDQLLESFECWDSLTLLSIIALASKDFGKELTTDQVRDSGTIKGLIQLITK
jgi:acyl carrier protein